MIEMTLNKWEHESKESRISIKSNILLHLFNIFKRKEQKLENNENKLQIEENLNSSIIKREIPKHIKFKEDRDIEKDARIFRKKAI